MSRTNGTASDRRVRTLVRCFSLSSLLNQKRSTESQIRQLQKLLANEQAWLAEYERAIKLSEPQH